MQQQVTSKWEAFMETHNIGMASLKQFPLPIAEPLIWVEQFLDLVSNESVVRKSDYDISHL
jgi:hypothetical protein